MAAITEKNKLEMARMRTKPRLYDYCYMLTKSNLKCFRQLKIDHSEQSRLDVLDIGCGNRPFEVLFADREVQYLGVDYSEDTGADIIHDLNEALPLSDSTFDIVIISETLEHVYNLKELLSEAVRVCKNTGSIFISTPFMYPVHGAPFDFHRPTKHFYIEFAKQNRLHISYQEVSNTILTTPIFIYMQMVMVLPVFPWVFKKALFFMANVVSVVLDAMAIRLTKNKGRARGFLEAAPAGIALILKPQNYDNDKLS